MQIKAISQIIDWDADGSRTVVLNKGDTGEVSDKFGQTKIDDGLAEAVEELPQLDHDGDGDAGGSMPHEPPALSGLKKAELLEVAAAEGVTADESMTNAQITEAIEAARAAAADDGDGEAPAT